MSEEQLYRAKIEPIPEGEPRPLWSVMIPTYNCANYLRETLASVLAQDPGPEIMQIEVVDDYSTHDDPAAVVQELGKGRVGFYRQEKNVGYIRNFETCLQRSRGHLLHILHGDDGVRDGFYHKLHQGFLEHPEIGAAYCRHIFMDENGHWQRISQLEQAESGILNNALERIAVRHPIQTPSIAVRRAVYEELGGFDRRISCSGEDWEMWVRIAARYPIWYEVEPLATYRTGITSLSGKAVRTGKDMQDIRKAYEMILPYLPPERARELSVKIRDCWAFAALANAVKFLTQGEFSSMTAQIREAINFKPSLKFFFVSVFYLSIAGAKYLTKQTDVEKMFLEADNKKVNSNSKAS
ncbi:MULTISPECIES: glycosyltransferase [unclassified Microcoleus]|uniref:glycosyltransferase n=1 Tax=unclassified Microcoleus TaxID=2642155 RepID=UPI002FD25181